MVCGEHIDDGVSHTVDCTQAQKHHRDRVQLSFKGTHGIPVSLVEGKAGSFDKEHHMVGSKADQEDGDDRDGGTLHLAFLRRTQALAELDAPEDPVVGERKDAERDGKAKGETQEVVAGYATAHSQGLKAEALLYFHVKQWIVNESNKNNHTCRNGDGSPLVAVASALKCIDHGHVAVAGNAAEQKDADVDVAEEDVSSHLAGLLTQAPFVLILDVDDPQRHGADVEELAEGQTEQVDG